MIKIEMPTAKEYTIIEYINAGWGIRAHKDPEMRPTSCPPMTFLGLAVMLSGMAKMIKDVAPMDATTTAFCSLRKTRTKARVNVARKL